MKQIITKEWEFTKTYIYDVVLRDGLINLDWEDFQVFAEKHHPYIAVKVEDDLSVGKLAKIALNEMKKSTSIKPSSIIISIYYKKDEEIIMEEMMGLSEILNDDADNDVQIKWGITPNDEIKHRRGICIFAFRE